MIDAPAKAHEQASIAQLKDIPDPPPPASWAPQATGWWVLGGILLAILLVVAYRRWRIWRRNRYRREAQSELARIEQALADPVQRQGALLALPALVKRTVLTWAPRADVAPLSGGAWLKFLDRTFEGDAFTEGAGRCLESLAYGVGEPSGKELDALLSLLHRWIDRHVPA